MPYFTIWMPSCTSSISHYFCSIQIWKVSEWEISFSFISFPPTLFGGFEISNGKVNRQIFNVTYALLPAICLCKLPCVLQFCKSNKSRCFIGAAAKSILSNVRKKLEEPSRCPLNSFFGSKQQQKVPRKHTDIFIFAKNLDFLWDYEMQFCTPFISHFLEGRVMEI